MKKKRQTSEELAAAWKHGRMTLDVALETHLRTIGVWPVDDGTFLMLQLAIGFFNLRMTDKTVPLSGDRNLTVAQVVEEFRLRPFLEDENCQGTEQA